MTDDLVVRLIAQVQPNLTLAALAEEAQDFPDAKGHRECARVCEEAAAEIERLRAEVALERDAKVTMRQAYTNQLANAIEQRQRAESAESARNEWEKTATNLLSRAERAEAERDAYRDAATARDRSEDALREDAERYRGIRAHFVRTASRGGRYPTQASDWECSVTVLIKQPEDKRLGFTELVDLWADEECIPKLAAIDAARGKR